MDHKAKCQCPNSEAIREKKKNIAINLYSFWLGSGFLDMTLKVQATEEKISYILSKLKNFVPQKTLSRK